MDYKPQAVQSTRSEVTGPSSLEPMDWTDRLLGTLASFRFQRASNASISTCLPFSGSIVCTTSAG